MWGSCCATLTWFLNLWEAAPCLAGWLGPLQLHCASKTGAKATAGQRLGECHCRVVTGQYVPGQGPSPEEREAPDCLGTPVHAGDARL